MNLPDTRGKISIAFFFFFFFFDLLRRAFFLEPTSKALGWAGIGEKEEAILGQIKGARLLGAFKTKIWLSFGTGEKHASCGQVELYRDKLKGQR